MKKVTFVVMIATILAKGSGLLRDLVLTYFFGASAMSDAYLISTTAPVVVISFIGVGISTGFIPAYGDINIKEGQPAADEFMSKLLFFIFLVFTAIVLLVLGNTEFVIKIFARGFDQDTLNIAVKMTKIAIFSIYFTGSFYIFSGYLNMKGSFSAPVLISLPLNIVTILSILLTAALGNIYAAAFGTVAAGFTEFLFLYLLSRKKGYRFRITSGLWDSHIKNILRLSIPIILGISLTQINTVIDQTIASSISEGGISALNYANKLNLFVYSIFVISIITVMYPDMAKINPVKDAGRLKETVSETLNGAGLFVWPASIGCMVFSVDIVVFLFGRGAFDEEAVCMTSQALFFYAAGMIGAGYREVLSRAFYSMQDTKTPMLNAAFGVLLNIVLNLILSRIFGIGGLALATSIAAVFTTALLFASLRKRMGPLGLKNMLLSSLKMLLASAIMGLIAKICFGMLSARLNRNLSLFAAIGIGAAFYFIILTFLKIEEIDKRVGRLRKKIKK